MRLIINIPTKDGKVDNAVRGLKDLLYYCERNGWPANLKDEIIIPDDDGEFEF